MNISNMLSILKVKFNSLVNFYCSETVYYSFQLHHWI